MDRESILTIIDNIRRLNCSIIINSDKVTVDKDGNMIISSVNRDWLADHLLTLDKVENQLPPSYLLNWSINLPGCDNNIFQKLGASVCSASRFGTG